MELLFPTKSLHTKMVFFFLGGGVKRARERVLNWVYGMSGKSIVFEKYSSYKDLGKGRTWILSC